MIAQSGPQLLLVAGAIAASASPAAVSWIYFASRLVELPLGLVERRDRRGADPETERHDERAEPIDVRRRRCSSTSALRCRHRSALALLATPIVALLFEHGAFTADDTRATALALTILADALPALALTKPLSAIFFAREQMMPAAARDARRPRVTHRSRSLAASALRICRRRGCDIARRLADRDLARCGAGCATANSPSTPAAIRNFVFIVLASARHGGGDRARAAASIAGGDGMSGRASSTLGALIALGMLVYAACLRLFGVVNFRVIRRAF